MSEQRDYISRSALIASFRSVAEGVGDSPWTIEAIEAMIERQESAPVEPVVYGRWIVKKNYHLWNYIATECFCSECKTLGSPQWKRCPVCETKMLPDPESVV